MSKFWKWFLGILLVLVFIGLFVASAFLMHGGFARGGFDSRGFQQYGQFERGPMMGGGQFYGFGGGPGWMMGGGGYGFHPLAFCGRLFGGLIPLLLLALIIYGAYRLGRHKSPAAVSSNAESTSLAAPADEPSDAPIAKTCRKCGSPIQEDWRNCPICGTKQ